MLLAAKQDIFITVITINTIIVINMMIIMMMKKPCSMFLGSFLGCFASNLDSCDPENHAPDYLDDDDDDDDEDEEEEEEDEEEEEHDVRFNDDNRRALMGWGTPVET